MPLFTNKLAPVVRTCVDKDTELDFRPNVTTLDEVRLVVAENVGRMANEIKIKNINSGKFLEEGAEFMEAADYKVVNISGREHSEEFWFEGLCIHAVNLDNKGLQRCLKLFLKETRPRNFAREKLIIWCAQNNYHRALDMVLTVIQFIEKEELKEENDNEKKILKTGKSFFSNKNRIAMAPVEEKTKYDRHAAKNRLLDWTFTNADGYTALHVAVELGHVRVAQHLIDFGADVECASSYGAQYSPLQVAVRSNKSVTDENGTIQTPPSHIMIVNLLLTAGSHLEAEDSYGNTALLIAAAEGSKESIKALLNSGANINHKNKNQETALDLVRRVRLEPLKKSLEIRLEKSPSESLFKKFLKFNKIQDSPRESNNSSESDVSKMEEEEDDFKVNKKTEPLLSEPSYSITKSQYARWQ